MPLPEPAGPAPAAWAPSLPLHQQLQLGPGHVDELQALLACHVAEAEVWAYGSRVTGGAHEGSDLDLVLRDPHDLSRDLPGWLELKEGLQASRLPILVDVHLWSRLPASFHAEIERHHVVVRRAGTARSVDPADADRA